MKTSTNILLAVIALLIISGCAPIQTGMEPASTPSSPAQTPEQTPTQTPSTPTDTPAQPQVPTIPPTDTVSKVGSISITTQPSNTNVSINGANVGAAPLVVAGLRYGTYTISASKQGYVSNSRAIVHDAEITYAQINLTSLETMRKLEAMKDMPGEIVFQGTPLNAEVYFEGSLIGKSPMTKRNVPVGNYTYTLKKPTYKDYTGTVEVKGGQTTTLKPYMEDAK